MLPSLKPLPLLHFRSNPSIFFVHKGMGYRTVMLMPTGGVSARVDLA